ncbi:MAG TPA: zinc-binding dehydrogenase, partial [Acidobacteriaceae bacterium]|nr:zinc-binding dehydrogenase [Acidobacteriaceae bacterium]
IVIEAVATPATWEQAVAIVRKGGTVNFFGGPPSGTVVGLDTNRLHYGDITLRASFHHTPAACARAFYLIQQPNFKAAHFLTRTASLTEVPEVFARMLTRSAEHLADIKTVILPSTTR